MGDLAELRRAKASLGDDYGPLDAEHIADDPIREERMAISIRMQHVVPEWQQKKSTKIDMCALICLHLLSRDDAPPLIRKDGNVFFPEMPQSRPGEVILQSNKILIYQEFPSFGPLVRSVFRFYNIPHLFIDGDMSYEARANITSKFTRDPSIRVLFFSSVGAIGLNLSVANIVVFLEQLWNAQDELQTEGRARRQPRIRCEPPAL